MIDDSVIEIAMLDEAADEANRARKLRKQIHKECQHSLHLGQAMHWLYLSLIGLTVGSSALASILALGFYRETGGPIVGVIALIPGICAGVSDRFRLRLKKHWYYRRYDKLNALLRRIDFVLPCNAGHADIARVSKDFCKVDLDMSRAWERLEEEEEHPIKAEAPA
jgi:hypothetical protein